MAMLLTTTAQEPDEELASRCLVLSVNEQPHQTGAIHQRQRQAYSVPVSPDQMQAVRARHRQAQRLLEPLTVIMPWAERLTFRTDQTRYRRDHATYLALIASLTLLHQHQRPRVTRHGRPCVVATRDDVAVAMGARQIVFVAKHVGGFCWWQTATTEYGIKETAWKGGRGDVLAELSASCRKHGLNLGIYVYPGDDTWGAAMGGGGRTKDPARQEAYNRVYRQQLTEVPTRYGQITEVWFDGSCVIDVSDILKEFPVVEGRFVRLDITEASGPPTIWEFHLDPGRQGWQPCGSWTPEDFRNGKAALTLDLSRWIAEPGQFEVKFEQIGGQATLRAVEAVLLYEGEEATAGLLTRPAGTEHIQHQPHGAGD